MYIYNNATLSTKNTPITGNKYIFRLFALRQICILICENQSIHVFNLHTLQTTLSRVLELNDY